MNCCAEKKGRWKLWWKLAAFGSAGAAAGFIAIYVFSVTAATVVIVGMLLLCPLLHLIGGHSHSPADSSTSRMENTRHH